MTTQHLYSYEYGKIHALYLAKVTRKGRTREELERVIGWLTGYDAADLERLTQDGTDMQTFVCAAPAMNPNRAKITGTICGIRLETIEDTVTREIRYLDKLVDELAKGRTMERILRD